ncbi:MAG: penicillin-insensitive murein endopeptidase [Limisphaerales bacterium]
MTSPITKNLRGTVAFCLALGLLAAVNVPAVEVELSDITAVVRTHFPEGSKGGVAVLVIKDNVVVHSKGYGLKNGKDPINSRTRMGLASVTKQFAAMCAALLIEDGKLRLTDKVSKHLPGVKLPQKGRELLVQDLVWHTSGLANFIKSREKAAIAEFKEKHGLERLNNQTHAEWLATMSLKRAPGETWEYTNSGYVLLARIVEVVSGKPFHEFQKERIFDVLGMSNTTDSTRFNGSGNMSLTLEDYAKWDRALTDGVLLNEQTTKLLYQSGNLDDGEPVGYGFGWHVVHKDGELVEMFHGGSGSAPTSSRNWIIRDVLNRVTVAFLARENPKFNRSYRERVAKDLRDAALGRTIADQVSKPDTKVRARVFAQIEKMRKGKQPSVSGGSLRSGLLKHPAELPSPKGVGYYRAHPTRESNFGSDRLVYGLMMLGAQLQETLGDHPYHHLCVRDMSGRRGGQIKYHINHQMGLDADLTFFASDLQGNPVSSVYTSYGADGKSSRGDRRFDAARNWELVTGILQNEYFGDIRAILVANPLETLLLNHAEKKLDQLNSPAERKDLKGLIERARKLMRQPSSSPHDNHFHLSLAL